MTCMKKDETLHKHLLEYLKRKLIEESRKRYNAEYWSHCKPCRVFRWLESHAGPGVDVYVHFDIPKNRSGLKKFIHEQFTPILFFCHTHDLRIDCVWDLDPIYVNSECINNSDRSILHLFFRHNEAPKAFSTCKDVLTMRSVAGELKA